jgi:hypothetical protein
VLCERKWAKPCRLPGFPPHSKFPFPLKQSQALGGIPFDDERQLRTQTNIMKRSIASLMVVGMTLLPQAPLLAAEPGQVDFGNFEAPGGGAEFVEVNIPGNLISLAARFVEKQEPDVAKLLTSVKQVRLNVIGLNEANKDEVQKRAQTIRTDLSSHGWERIVTAQKQEQDVNVFLKMDQNSAIQGLAVVVIEGSRQAVFVNIVGNIKPEQLTMLGEKLNIEPLKKVGEATASETK